MESTPSSLVPMDPARAGTCGLSPSLTHVKRSRYVPDTSVGGRLGPGVGRTGDVGADVAGIRITYNSAHLSEPDLAPDWMTQFGHWLVDAVESLAFREPNAMVLATADAAGRRGAPGVPGGVGRVLRDPPARCPARRLGQPAVVGDRVPAGAGRCVADDRSAVRRRRAGAAARTLGRVPDRAGHGRVLAGPAESAARPAAVPPDRAGRLGDRTTRPVICTRVGFAVPAAWSGSASRYPPPGRGRLRGTRRLVGVGFAVPAAWSGLERWLSGAALSGRGSGVGAWVPFCPVSAGCGQV